MPEEWKMIFRTRLKSSEGSRSSAFSSLPLTGCFSSVGLFVVNILLAVAGANIFILLELPDEEEKFQLKREYHLTINSSMNYIASQSWMYVKDKDMKLNETEFYDNVDSMLNDFIKLVVVGIKEKQYDGGLDTWDYDWSFPKAFLFAVTIMTTIGYGHISPKTVSGRYFTIFYSFIGIAVLLIFLGKCGGRHGCSL